MLELDFNFEGPHRIEEIVLPTEAEPPLNGQPALPALRSLTLRNLPLSLQALDQLLACCPQLLELTLDRMSGLGSTVWSSFLRCRQLLSLRFHAYTDWTPMVAFTGGTVPRVVSSSSSSGPSTVGFPCLSHLDLSLDLVSGRGLAQILRLFDGCPSDHSHCAYAVMTINITSSGAYSHAHTSHRCCCTCPLRSRVKLTSGRKTSSPKWSAWVARSCDCLGSIARLCDIRVSSTTSA